MIHSWKKGLGGFMNSSIYLIFAVVILLFILLMWVLKKAAAIFKRSFLLFLLLIGLICGIAIYSSNTGQAAMAAAAIKSWLHSPVVKANSILEQKFDFSFLPIKDQVHLDIPAISQNPELPRGCEVTSLVMLLNSAGVNVNKMVLAEKVKKRSHSANCPQWTGLFWKS